VYQNVGKTWKTWHLSIMSHHKHKSHSNNRKPTPRISCKPKSVDAKKPLKTCCKTAVNRDFSGTVRHIHSISAFLFVCGCFLRLHTKQTRKCQKKSQQINNSQNRQKRASPKVKTTQKYNKNQSAMFRGSVFLQ